MSPNDQIESSAASFGESFLALAKEIKRHIVGQTLLVERLLAALIADGHVLLEGVPGLAKTRVLSVLTRAIDARMARVQFTPDLLPADLIGTEIYRPETGQFIIRKGPVFTNLLLADEINRAPAKVQSALLQAMQEREVTIGEETFKLPVPFMVLATQNPIEQAGTYPLPEAQVDRFLMKLKLDYPSFQEELNIVNLVMQEAKREIPVAKVVDLSGLDGIRQAAMNVHVDSKIDNYIVSLVQATRNVDQFGLKGLVDWGASPRASISLKACARALSFVRGKSFVSPDEVKELAPDVLRHRILTSFEAEARGVDSDEIIRVLLKSVTVP